MIITCPHGCGALLDDEFRSTVCPHGTFAANDGRNNFRHHPEAYLEPTPANASPTSQEASPEAK